MPPFVLPVALGGTGDITYEIDNTLISGLNGIPTDTQFDGNNRRVTGTPSVGGEFSFGYKATDSSGTPQVITTIITVQVADDEATLPFRFDLASQSMPGLKKGEAIGTVPPFQLPVALGGSGNITYEIDNTLISGLNGIPTDTQFDGSTRRITGTPSAGGEFSFGYKATDESDPPQVITTIITLQVEDDQAALPFRFDPFTEYSPGLKKGEAIGTVPPFQLPIALGGTGDITYEIDNTLISGLNGIPTDTQFDANSRRVTGTPSAAGEFSFGYKATDESDPPQVISTIITVQVEDDQVILPFRFDPFTEYSPGLKKGEAIGTVPPFQLPEALGGTGNITYEIDNTLISGLNGIPTDTQFDGSTRRVTGTPSAGGEFSFGYKATDESDPPKVISTIITVQVQDDEVTLPFRFDLASQSMPGLKKGEAIGTVPPFVLPVALGGTGDITYEIDNTLISGLNGIPTDAQFDASTRRVTGTPSAAGEFSFGYKATDESDPPKVISTIITVQVQDDEVALPFRFDIASQSMPGLKKGEAIGTVPPFELPIALGGTGDITYEIDNTLISGLNGIPTDTQFDGSTRRITGTPSAGGEFSFGYKATDESDPPQVISTIITVQVEDDQAELPFRFDLATEFIPGMKNGEAIGTIPPFQLPVALGGSGDITYAIDNTLISGLSGLPADTQFNAGNRRVTGTPSQDGIFSFGYKATDESVPPQVISTIITIEVAPADLAIPKEPEGVAHDSPFPDHIRIYWTSTGNFQTYIELDVTEDHEGPVLPPVTIRREITAGLSYTFFDLMPGWSYQYRVRHFNAAGNGPWFTP